MDEPFLFVPLQVPNDAQLRLFGGEFKSVDDFVSSLASAASSLPEGWHLTAQGITPRTQVFGCLKRSAQPAQSRIWLGQ